MRVVRSNLPPRPAAISPTQEGGAKKSLNPSASALAKTLDWHQRYSSPACVKEYHAAFRAALASDALRADFSRALTQDYPATAQAVAGFETGGKAVGAASDLPTTVAANSLGEALIRQRTKSPVEEVRRTYLAFRGALATTALRSDMDRYLLSTNRDLARELGLS